MAFAIFSRFWQVCLYNQRNWCQITSSQLKIAYEKINQWKKYMQWVEDMILHLTNRAQLPVSKNFCLESLLRLSPEATVNRVADLAVTHSGVLISYLIQNSKNRQCPNLMLLTWHFNLPQLFLFLFLPFSRNPDLLTKVITPIMHFSHVQVKFCRSKLILHLQICAICVHPSPCLVYFTFTSPFWSSHVQIYFHAHFSFTTV